MTDLVRKGIHRGSFWFAWIFTGCLISLWAGGFHWGTREYGQCFFAAFAFATTIGAIARYQYNPITD